MEITCISKYLVQRGDEDDYAMFLKVFVMQYDVTTLVKIFVFMWAGWVVSKFPNQLTN